jgi:3-deoxy-D-manno-octulosonic acid kinase
MHSACGGRVKGIDITMNPQHHQEENCHILYDEALTGQVTRELFTPEFWQASQAVIGQAHGRGTTWFVRHGDATWVLRRYQRGGSIAVLLGDRYLWTGLSHTRPWREWHMLAHLHAAGLPVPKPVAALACRAGLYYRAALLTEHIPNCRTLAEHLMTSTLPEEAWRAIGHCLRRLHQAGAFHADLNAHNILLNQHGEVFVIDFDRGKLRRPDAGWQRANLRRLRHSLRKLAAQFPPFHFTVADFNALQSAYHGS